MSVTRTKHAMASTESRRQETPTAVGISRHDATVGDTRYECLTALADRLKAHITAVAGRATSLASRANNERSFVITSAVVGLMLCLSLEGQVRTGPSPPGWSAARALTAT